MLAAAHAYPAVLYMLMIGYVDAAMALSQRRRISLEVYHSGVWCDLAIDCKVAARGLAPIEVAAHGPPLHSVPSGGSSVERDGAVEAPQHRRSGRLAKGKAGGTAAADRPFGCVDDCIGESSYVSYDRKRTVTHRVEGRQPARLKAARVQEKVCSRLQPVSEWLLVADPHGEPATIVLRRVLEFGFKNRISFAQQGELHVAFKDHMQCVINDVGHLLIGDPAEPRDQWPVGIDRQP